MSRSSLEPAILTGMDPGLHRLSGVGADFGANREALISSVSVRLAAIAVDSGPPVGGSDGSLSIAPATSSSLGSVYVHGQIDGGVAHVGLGRLGGRLPLY